MQAGSDIRFAFRTLRRRRAYAALAVGTLALGIGAATTIYGIVDGVLLRPMPFAESHRLIAVYRTYPHWREQEALQARWDRNWFSYPGFREWQERQTAFDAVAVWAGSDRTLTGFDVAEQVGVVRASSSLLQVLGAHTAIGRFFLPGEDGTPSRRVAVISHEMWQTRFGASPAVIGRTLRLDDTPYEIVGVLPPGLDLAARGRPASVWIPAGGDPSDARAGSNNFFAIGRLRAGVTLEQATDETARLVAESSPPNPVGARLAPWQSEITRTARRPLLLLLGASAVLLLLACVNVATLMLGEASGRVDEFATRAALGAGRGRVTRQVVTESLMIAALAVVAGTLLAWFATSLLIASAPANVPRLADVRLDARVLGVACMVAALTAVLFGLVPAGSVMTASPARLLGSGPGRTTRRHDSWALRALIASQVSLSCLLLVGAALLARSLQKLGAVDPGFPSEGLVVIGLGTTGGRIATSEDALTRFYADAAERIAAIPGVERAAVGSAIPFTGGGSSSTFTVEGYTFPGGADGIEARRSHVVPGFLETFGLRLLAGRGITSQDRA
ncbi:MAG TPA: ABC transporter permease, partial [Gemmatimonadaceae bacterium]|nr:ABC transporter permease [Gemmatimonadaceae bacterium]